MTEPRLAVVRRDLRGVAKVLQAMRGRVSSFPDLVEVVDIIARNLMACVIEVESIQKETIGIDIKLRGHRLIYEKLLKRVADLEERAELWENDISYVDLEAGIDAVQVRVKALETQVGLEWVMEES